MPAVAGRTGGGKREVEMWASEKWTMWGSEMCDVGEMWALWGSTRISPHYGRPDDPSDQSPFLQFSQHSLTALIYSLSTLDSHSLSAQYSLNTKHSFSTQPSPHLIYIAQRTYEP